MHYTSELQRPRFLTLQTPGPDLDVLAHVLMQGPQGQRVWWELYWHQQSICFRNLADFRQQGSTGVPCEQPESALAIIRQVWQHPQHQLGLGLAWQVENSLAAERLWLRAGFHQHACLVLEFGALQEILALSALASMPLPDPQHLFWQHCWSASPVACNE